MLFSSPRNIVTKYWTKHNVTHHHTFSSVDDSLDFLDWRNKCYLYYEDLMPTNTSDGLTVLDYGCGPGHDLVGFAINSTPKKLIAADVSKTSIQEAKNRLLLHQKACEFIDLSENQNSLLPLEDESIDLIHSSGVLHHTEDPFPILQEFRRVIKPDGRIQIMVYNYDSIWVHLYVAYELMINDSSFKNSILRKLGLKKYYENLEEAFRKSTDGIHCPISRFYKHSEFLDVLSNAGFSGTFKGASISNWMEMNRLNKRFAALADRRFPKEHRDFLYKLSFNKKGVPIYEGHVAGIGACYEATPI
jgi:ubiquinone/menaquinone biosynthesis C-methylase UbiE